jgi:hypothetical protein
MAMREFFARSFGNNIKNIQFLININENMEEMFVVSLNILV